ncbi:MAG: mRNA surveillance protein pelota [Thermoprotei archaeon]
MRMLEYAKKQGSATVQVTSPNDLWLLEAVLTPGVLVGSKTTRMTKSPDGEERGARVTTYLAVQVSKVSYEPFGQTLRITGKVVGDPDELGVLGSYHTIVVDTGSVITITKETWTTEELDMLSKDRITEGAMIVSVDYQEAAVAKVWDYGVQTLASWSTGIPGKDDPKRDQKLEVQIEKIAQEIQRFLPEKGLLILAGPGYIKQKIADRLGSLLKAAGVHVRISLVDTSYAGSAGIKEAVNKTLEKGVLTEVRFFEESKLVDRLLSELSKGEGKALVGFEDLEKIAETGAVDTLLISTWALRNNHERAVKLMITVERYGGKIEIVSDSHEKGEQLVGLGGAGALLRYRVSLE